jgi:predicted XRE-type DNA-binding protein
MSQKSKPGNITRGSILRELGLDPQDAIELELKAILHHELMEIIRGRKLSPRQLEKMLDVPQPRISEFMTGKLDLLSIPKLLLYASRLGVEADIRLKRRAA